MRTTDQKTPDNYYNHSRYIIIRNLLYFLVFVFLVLSFVNYFAERLHFFYIFTAAFIFSASNLFYLIYSKKFIVSYYLYVFMGTALCTYVLFNSSSTFFFADFLWRFTVIILAFIGINRLVGSLVTAYFLVEASIFVQYYLLPNLDHPSMVTDAQLVSINIGLIVPMVVNTYLIIHFINLQKMAYHKMDKAYEAMAYTNDENIMLLKEIHHRVKNNLQVVTSLLRLQKDELESENAKEQYTGAINRVVAMSSIHEKLYRQNQLSELKVKPYIDDLAVELKSLYAADKSIDFYFDFGASQINLNTIIPLGLIINELLTNSFKYAFTDAPDRSAQITISLKEFDNGFSLLYRDSGKWLVPDNSSNFGTELIGILTEQINGTYQLKKMDTGTEYSFKFQKVTDTPSLN